MCYNVIVFDWADPTRVKLLRGANSVKYLIPQFLKPYFLLSSNMGKL